MTVSRTPTGLEQIEADLRPLSNSGFLNGFETAWLCKVVWLLARHVLQMRRELDSLQSQRAAEVESLHHAERMKGGA
jgi:hypothetical protein